MFRSPLCLFFFLLEGPRAGVCAHPRLGVEEPGRVGRDAADTGAGRLRTKTALSTRAALASCFRPKLSVTK